MSPLCACQLQGNMGLLLPTKTKTSSTMLTEEQCFGNQFKVSKHSENPDKIFDNFKMNVFMKIFAQTHCLLLGFIYSCLFAKNKLTTYDKHLVRKISVIGNRNSVTNEV